MKRTGVILTIFSVMLFLIAPVANAITLVPGPYEAKYDNFEGFFEYGTFNPVEEIVPGVENKGIFKITDIRKYPGIVNDDWWNDSMGEELTGYFYGITVESVTPNGTGFDVRSTGGQLDLYYDSTPDFDGSLANAINGDLMVSFLFTGGIYPADPTITVNGSVNVTTNPASGQAFAYLSVISGSGLWAEYFDGNAVPGLSGYPAGTDAINQSNFNPNETGVYEDLWSITSFDPFRGTIVPEPSSILLIGTGLIGLAALGRRKFLKRS